MACPNGYTDQCNVRQEGEETGAALFAAATQYQEGLQKSAHVKLGTKNTLIEKSPDLWTVINRWIALHEAERDDDQDVSLDDCWQTFQNELGRCRAEFDKSGLESKLPTKVSAGWFCNRTKKRYGAHDSSAQISEVKRASPDALATYRSNCTRKLEEHDIPKEAVAVFDELRDFILMTPKRVQSTQKERNERHTCRRVRRFGRGRATNTVGFTCILLY